MAEHDASKAEIAALLGEMGDAEKTGSFPTPTKRSICPRGRKLIDHCVLVCLARFARSLVFA